MAYNILNNSHAPSLRKLLIALHHDSIEDTDYDFHTLETSLNIKIALWVLIISKQPFMDLTLWTSSDLLITKEFMDIQEEMKKFDMLREDGLCLSQNYLNKKYCNRHLLKKEEQILEQKWLLSLSDWEKYQYIKSSGILNRKWLLSDYYLNKKNFYPNTITLEERFFENLYEELNIKYKTFRNTQYFSHMLPDFDKWPTIEEFKNSPCINNFYNHVLQVINHNSIVIDINTIKDIVFDSLEVKFWDRIDNLATTEVYHKLTNENVKKAYRKIEETTHYFYNISQEFDALRKTDFCHLINTEIKHLQSFIFVYTCNSIMCDSQDQISDIVDKKQTCNNITL